MRKEQIRCLREVLEEFGKNNMGYCILRNYEFFFDEMFEVESLDTAVTIKDFPMAENILLSFGFVQRKPQFSLKHKAFFKLLGEEVVSFDVQVGGVYWNDMNYLGEEIIDHRIKKEFFYVPSNEDTFVMLLVHSILGKRCFKLKYQQILHSLSYDTDYVLPKLSDIFSPRIALKLMNATKTGTLQNVNTHYLVLRFLFSRPSRLFTFTTLFFRWVRWKKIFRAYPLIVFIGPDGAGKSTVVRGLSAYLQKKGRHVSVVYMGRGRGQVLPFFSMMGRTYKRLEKKRDALLVRNGTASMKKKIVYTLSAPMFTLDLLLRYVISVFGPRRCRTMMITDRYCSDIYLMKHVPLRLKRLLFSLFPRPTLTFYLYNDAAVLHERRPEESVEELRRQMTLFYEISGRLNAVIIKTDNKQTVREEVVRMVFGYLLREWY